MNRTVVSRGSWLRTLLGNLVEFGVGVAAAIVGAAVGSLWSGNVVGMLLGAVVGFAVGRGMFFFLGGTRPGEPEDDA